MISKSARKAFFALLRAGLWNDIEPDLAVFPLPDEEWESVYVLSAQQTVQGIVFDGLLKLPNQYLPPKGLLLKWTVEIDRIERRSQAMNHAVAELAGLFADHSIQVFLLKGQGVAMCYENPLHRVCGDIDWYFPSAEDYRRAGEIIKSQGINLQSTAGFSAGYFWKGIEVEHHSRLIDIHNPFCQRYLRRLIDERLEDNAWLECKDGVSVPLPSPLLASVAVNAHILKHLLSFGVGVRQLCDSARIYQAYSSALSNSSLEEIYKKIGILEWIHLLHQLLVKFIGMPENCLPFVLPFRGHDGDWMMDEILSAGNFGFYDMRFGSPDGLNGGKREHSFARIARAGKLYAPYALTEVLWFPFIQLLSRLNKNIGS